MTERVCSIEGCGGTGRMCRGMCWAHYMRWYATGDPGPAQIVRRPRGRTCTVEGCGRKHQGRGYCDTHLQRFIKHGDPGPAEIGARRPGAVCSVDGCEGPHSGLGFCDKHYQRFKRYGAIDLPPAGRRQGRPATYASVHQDLRRERGPASAHSCVDCGGEARQWSYNHRSDLERRDPKTGKPFSVELACYEPRCLTCHRRLDAERTRRDSCSVDGCTGKHKARGLCSKHYQRWRAART